MGGSERPAITIICAQEQTQKSDYRVCVWPAITIICAQGGEVKRGGRGGRGEAWRASLFSLPSLPSLPSLLPLSLALTLPPHTAAAGAQ
eukprot:2909971-Rhodomonas_salina.1